MKSKVCPSCPPGTPPKPLCRRFWHQHRANKDGFDGICAVCRRAKVNESRRKNHRSGLGSQVYPEFVNGDTWRWLEDGRELDIVVTSVITSGFGNFVVLGVVRGRRRTVLARTLRTTGRCIARREEKAAVAS